MIFTQRFGTLQARQTFPSITEVEAPVELEELLQKVENDEAAEKLAA